MLYAYGATVVEIVRRKEFGELEVEKTSYRLLRNLLAQFFYQRAQGILEVMAKLSYVNLSSVLLSGSQFNCDRTNERKRRQVYRGEVHGLLPFETKGMDEPVPTVDFTVGGSSDLPYSLHRTDIDGNQAFLVDNLCWN